ncbi:MAG: 2-oxoacid:acceptor oxidoreductase family protein [Candidatus Thorarchaeota archaeon]
MSKTYNILVAGVGGQGNLVCGRALADASCAQGMTPVVGQIFGASQRGGSVYTHVRIADHDTGPLIPRGRVDMLLGLEPLETLRAALDYAGPQTIVALSTMEVRTTATRCEEDGHPNSDQVVKALATICAKVYPVDAGAALRVIGTARALNAYMLGVLAALGNTPLHANNIKASLAEIIPLTGMNLAAFGAGAQDIMDVSPVGRNV